MAAKMLDINAFIQAGMNPKTGLPERYGSSKQNLKAAIKKQLQILDEQNAINRYTWFNLPSGLDGQLLERILYYKGQGMFFYMEADENFYFLPYALAGTIDVYGRYKQVTPLPFNGTATNAKDAWITGLLKTPKYDFGVDVTVNDFLEGCVLLGDYSKQIAQTIVSREQLQQPILDTMSEAFPMARTNLLANSGIKAMRVMDQDSQAQVNLASSSIEEAALSGEIFIPVVSSMEINDLTSGGSALKSEEFLLYMQAVDNYRLSLYGLDNGGLFQKKAHMLEAEQDMNAGNVGLIYQDGLTLRQNFCDAVNAIWGLGISCEASECVLNLDTNGDGKMDNDKDQSGVPGEQADGSMDGGEYDE